MPYIPSCLLLAASYILTLGCQALMPVLVERLVSIAALGMAVLFPGAALASACIPTDSTPGPSLTPISQEAWITMAGGRVYRCTVEDYYHYGLWFKLMCANGSAVTVGMEGPPSPGSRGYTTYALVRDKGGREYRMHEHLYPGWRDNTCSNGIATSAFKYRLSNPAFSYNLTIIQRFRQKGYPAPSTTY